MKQDLLNFLLRLKKIMKLLIILLNVWFVKKTYEEDEVKVKDHDHDTGRSRRSVHQECILNLG